MAGIHAMERRLLDEPLTADLLWDAKRMGFSDEMIAALADDLPQRVRERRETYGITPVYKMVDTCAAEFDAVTPYYWSTYEHENEAQPEADSPAVVIGSGPIRIGQGIEFDYCSVHAAWALQAAGRASVMINSNPETVSTDFDSSTRLYFEALDVESVADVLANEGQRATECRPPSRSLAARRPSTWPSRSTRWAMRSRAAAREASTRLRIEPSSTGSSNGWGCCVRRGPR